MHESNVALHLAILAVSFFILIPAAIGVLWVKPSLQKVGIFLAMLLLIFSPSLQINFLADPVYVKGTTQAYEISYLDFFAIIYFVILILKPDYKFKFWIGGTTFFLIYLFFCTISYVDAPVKLYWAFELFRLVKMWFFIVVLANVVIYYNCFSEILLGLAGGVIINFADMIFQKYGLGRYASVGVIRHKNNAGMYFNILMPTFLFLALNFNFKDKRKSIFYMGMFLICSASTVFTVSRGAWAVFVLNFAAVFCVSIFRGFTRKKIWTLVGIILVLTLGVAKSYDTLYERLTVGNAAGTQGRRDLVDNATDMARQHTFGVGFNNYTAANDPEHNYGGIFDKLLVGDRNIGKVETIYLLTAAEIGWCGLASMLLWFFYYFWQAFLCTIKFWRSNMLYLSFGLCVGLGGAYLHSTLEWSLRYSQNFYLLAVIFSLVTGLAYFRKYGISELQNRS